MKSFANYRWVIAVTVFAAVLAVYFYRPSAAWAVPTSAVPTGPGGGQCSSGECVSAPSGDGADCAACAEANTPSSAFASMSLFFKEGSTLEDSGGGGNREDPSGKQSRPGTRDGMLHPCFGAEGGGYITYAMPIGICGTSLGLGREAANAVAMDQRPNAGRAGREADGPGDGGPVDPVPPAEAESSPPEG